MDTAARYVPTPREMEAAYALVALSRHPLEGAWAPPSSAKEWRYARDISIGKNTAGYALYAATVPREQRVPWQETNEAATRLVGTTTGAAFLDAFGPHPVTPTRFRPNGAERSKRDWDGMMRAWKCGVRRWSDAYMRTHEVTGTTV